ncbi:MAG: dihydropteroate synthase [Pirellulaceae bacterium]|nr:dihydropteroate synthase [Pirellulaceae bacterium]
MGIVNVTPDSFSDGGKFFSRQWAVEHALRLEDAGANIIDIGGESTRPYSQPVSLADELERVIPIIQSLSGRLSIPISIDTSKAAVAQAAIDSGAQIINDVTGLTGDPQMIAVAASSQAGICAMHMQGTPQTMQDSPQYDDVVEDIFRYLTQRDAALLASGISADRICLDPGIGFGKTHEHNWTLLRGCSRFLALGRPILVGHSRKGVIRKLVGENSDRIAAGSVGVSLALAQQGIQILRVHDVEATCAALSCFAQITQDQDN